MTSHFIARNYAEDHTNRIHSDDVAREYGFKGALVPGVGIYSYIIAPAVTKFGTDWLRSGTASVKFLKPVYDGDRVSVHSAELDASSVHLELQNADGILCAIADASLGTVSKGIEASKYPVARLPLPENRSAPIAASMPVGTVLGSLEGVFDSNALGGNFDPMVRPAALLLALANDIVAANVILGPWIHTGSVVAHFDTLEEGESFSLRGSITDSGEKRGHDFIVADLGLFGESDRPIASIKHSALIRLSSAASSSPQ